ncbi:MAG: divalent-cation tolerance protein CutA [Nanoarchaeota archaeon]|nr:divalent-cation tolerance protein CutA [Nanoarchaeota archaeon]
MKYIIIKTTFAKKEEAEEVAKKIIDSNLAACIQISEVESYYRWNNKIEKSNEYKVEIKTVEKNYGKIEELITENHNYEIPEIVAYKLSNGSKKYFEWIKKEVK